MSQQQSQSQGKKKAQGVPMPLPIQEESKQVHSSQQQNRNQKRQQEPNKQKAPQKAPQTQTQENLMLSNLITSISQLLVGQVPSQQVRQRSTSAKMKKKDRPPSLHIGNLPEKFYDLDLFKFIKNSGHNVIKAIVCLNKETQKSFCYGYAQFQTIDEAKQAQKQLNNTMINDKVITVSLQKDNAKFNDRANLLIRNLAPTVKQKDVHELFSKHGTIVKCKLECFNDGLSRGFAYVQFEKEKDANKALKELNGQSLHEKNLEIFVHEKKKSVKNEENEKLSNNIFVQGIPKGIDEQKLKEIFSEFGEIISAQVNHADSDNTFDNNGFVCFKETDSAQNAIKKMNKNKNEDGTFLLVCPHIAKRKNEMTQDKRNAPIAKNMKKFFDSNVFVNFIPAEISAEDVQKTFASCGNIISVKMKNKKLSRYQQAYVLYENVDEAQNAIRTLDQSRPFGAVPIEVQFWVSKDDLANEREEKQKQERKRLIQSELHNLQYQLRGQSPQSRAMRRGAYQGRGGRPATGGKNPTKSKSPPKQPAKTILVPLPKIDTEKIIAITDVSQKKQLVGDAIYPCIEQVMGDHAGKITGMLLDEKVVNFQRLLTDQKYLSDLSIEALRLLQASSAAVKAQN